MKLHEVPRGTWIRTKTIEADKLFFSHLDGMYSYCTDEDGSVVHLAAMTEVEIVENSPENSIYS